MRGCSARSERCSSSTVAPTGCRGPTSRRSSEPGEAPSQPASQMRNGAFIGAPASAGEIRCPDRTGVDVGHDDMVEREPEHAVHRTGRRRQHVDPAVGFRRPALRRGAQHLDERMRGHLPIVPVTGAPHVAVYRRPRCQERPRTRPRPPSAGSPWPCPAARSGPARSPWPAPWPTPSPTTPMSWSRPARARASRSPISCPAICSGKRVVVATATKALQDQLVGKDLPFLERHLGRSFSYACLKGRSNYLCVQRAREAGGDAQLGLGEEGGRDHARAVRQAGRGADRLDDTAAGRQRLGRPGRAPVRAQPGGVERGQRHLPRVPGRQPVPGRGGVLRRAGQRRGGRGRRRGGQHPPVRDAPGRGGRGAPRARRRGRRRGARAGRGRLLHRRARAGGRAVRRRRPGLARHHGRRPVAGRGRRRRHPAGRRPVPARAASGCARSTASWPRRSPWPATASNRRSAPCAASASRRPRWRPARSGPSVWCRA